MQVMSAPTKPCPYCGEPILAIAKKCRYCGEYLDPSARPAPRAPDAMERMLMPVGRPTSAIAAGYLGLLALFPFLGAITGPLALVFGIQALKSLRRNPELSGRGRAWFGIIFGGFFGILQIVLVVFMIIGLLVSDKK